MANAILTAAQVRELLDYDPHTGLFRWVVRRSWKCKPGWFGGSPDTAGYLRIGLLGGYYSAHRLAWLHTHGDWPHPELDHSNRDKSDNRMCNLREVTRSQNMVNRDSYVSGGTMPGVVQRMDRKSSWRATITVGGKTHYLGSFKTRDAAVEARVSAEKRLCSVEILRPDLLPSTC